ncbi:MAG: hypothetical protein KIH10_17055 [Candidatus Freyarchaeota archaeon]|nr:hypothetical protein [Candidatus Jordarchaeia archaeon]
MSLHVFRLKETLSLDIFSEFFRGVIACEQSPTQFLDVFLLYNRFERIIQSEVGLLKIS